MLHGVPDPPMSKGQILGVNRPTEKHLSHCCAVRSKKINNGIEATVAADCIAPDWPVSYQLFPREKSAPAMWHVVKIL